MKASWWCMSIEQEGKQIDWSSMSVEILRDTGSMPKTKKEMGYHSLTVRDEIGHWRAR
jgi:hypothetical protein